MGETVLWALLSGGITGGIWVAIVLLARQRRLNEVQAGLRDELERRLDQLQRMDTRIEELESRLDLTERVLAQERKAARLTDGQRES